MTPRRRLVVHAGPISPEDAERVMVERKVKKLPLVEPGRRADRPDHRARSAPSSGGCRSRRATTRDACASAPRLARKGDYLERAAELIKAGVDVLVIDIAHGHSVVMDRAIGEVAQAIRRRRADRRQRRHGRGRAGSCSSAASTASRSASGPAAAARRA